MQYIGYLQYLLKHKWYVLVFGLKLKLPLLMLLLHDWDKLLPSRIYFYSNFFYNKDGKDKKIRDKNGYFNPENTGDKNFDYHRFMHLHINKHHWQYWTMIDGYNNLTVIEMPEIYIKEMIADWSSAGKMYNSRGIKNWYSIHKEEIVLHENSRKFLESMVV